MRGAVDRLPVEPFVIRAAQDPGAVAREFERHLPGALRFLTRGLGTRKSTSADSLSFLLFEPGYLRALIALGERDAESSPYTIGPFLHLRHRPMLPRGALQAPSRLAALFGAPRARPILAICKIAGLLDALLSG